DHHHRHRHPALAHADPGSDVLPRPDPEHLHSRRACPRRGPARRRLHRGAREHQPPPPPARPPAPEGPAPPPSPTGHAHLRLHHHHHRRLFAPRVPRRSVAPALHPPDLHHLVLALRLLPRLPHGDAAPLLPLALERARDESRVRSGARRPPAEGLPR